MLREDLAFVSDSETKAIAETIPISTAVREGRRRDKDDWHYTLNNEPDLIADRGFTGHENLGCFGLINMNGRLYDPVVGRFLSPDNYVQMPDFTQNFNRYAYALNNPLKFIDPSGELFGIDDLVWLGIGIYATFMYLKAAHDNRDPVTDKWAWNPLNWAYFELHAGANTDGDITVGGLIGTGGNSIGVAYNSNNGVGIVHSDRNGNKNYYYPGHNSSAPERQVNEAIYNAQALNYTSSCTDNEQSGMLGWWNDKASQVAFLVSAASYNMGKEMARWRPSFDGWGNTVVKAGTNFKPWVVNTGKVLRIGGGIVGGITTGYSVYQFKNNPNWEDGTNTVFGIISFFGIPGMAVSGFYSATKANIEYTQKHPQYCQGGMGMYRWSCFVAGTKVTMGDYSYKNIENIVVGDSIITYNFQNKKLEICKVTEMEEPVHDGLIQIEFSDGTKIINTEAHPYYTKNKGWCSYNPELSFVGFKLKASMLEKGDKCFVIKNKNLSELKITKITELPGEEKTYNIIGISKNSNYFVHGILVHNESFVNDIQSKEK